MPGMFTILSILFQFDNENPSAFNKKIVSGKHFKITALVVYSVGITITCEQFYIGF